MNAQTLLAVFLAEARQRSLWTWDADEARELAAVQLIDAAPVTRRRELLILAAEALAVPEGGEGRYDSAWSSALGFLVSHLLGQELAASAPVLARLAQPMRRWPAWDWLDTPPYDLALDVIQQGLAGRRPASDLAAALRALRTRLAVEGAWDQDQRARLARLDRLLAGVGPDADGAGFETSDAWGEAANAWILRQPPPTREAWWQLIDHAASAVRSHPSRAWLQQAGRHVAELQVDALADGLATWFPHVPTGLTRAQAEHRDALAVRYQTRDDPLPRALGEPNRTRVRGLCWACATVDGRVVLEAHHRLVGALHALAARGYARIPRVGAGDLRLANAAVYGLRGQPARLSRPALEDLRERVSHRSALRVLDDALRSSGTD